MIMIEKSQEVQAPIDSVWKLVSDLDNEHKNWPMLRDVKILGKTDNSVEREVKIRRGPMGEAKSIQTLVVDAPKKSTMLTMTKGPMLGTRKVVLSKLSDDITRVDINWEFNMKGVPRFALGFVKDNISDVTDKALTKIKEDVETSVSLAQIKSN